MDELLPPVSTLDEPVMETIMRDVRAVGVKLKAVLIPLDRNVRFFLVSTQVIYCNKHLPYFINNRDHLNMSVYFKRKM